MEHERTQEHRVINPDDEDLITAPGYEPDPDSEKLYKELVERDVEEDRMSLRKYALAALVTICLTIVGYHGVSEFADASEKSGIADANAKGWSACVAAHSPKDCR